MAVHRVSSMQRSNAFPALLIALACSSPPAEERHGANGGSGGVATGGTAGASVGGSVPGTYAAAAFGASFALAKTEDVASETPVEMDYWLFGAEWADSLGADVISSSLGYSEFDLPNPSYTYADMDGRIVPMPVSEAEFRAGLRETLSRNNAATLVADAASRRWTSGADLADALERLAVIATVRSAGAKGTKVGDELFAVRQVIDSSPELRSALADPARSVADRSGLLAGLLSGKVEAATDTLVTRAVVRGRGTIDANLDDMSPELAGPAMDALFAAGAIDAWWTPITMKKGRPAFTLSALAPAPARDAVIAAILRETNTIGVRFSTRERTVLARRSVEVTTRYGAIAVKVAMGPTGETQNVAPEYEACAAAARKQNSPAPSVAK